MGSSIRLYHQLLFIIISYFISLLEVSFQQRTACHIRALTTVAVTSRLKSDVQWTTCWLPVTRICEPRQIFRAPFLSTVTTYNKHYSVKLMHTDRRSPGDLFWDSIRYLLRTSGFRKRKLFVGNITGDSFTYLVNHPLTVRRPQYTWIHSPKSVLRFVPHSSGPSQIFTTRVW